LRAETVSDKRTYILNITNPLTGIVQ
jgi:hypothetical protein